MNDHYNLYSTDYGDVRVSQREAMVIQTMSEKPHGCVAPQRYVDLYEAIVAACIKYAKHKAGIV